MTRTDAEKIFRDVTGGNTPTVGDALIWTKDGWIFRQATDVLYLTQGVDVPAAESGYLKIFFDKSDNNLKIKLEDGTVKTFTLV